MNAPHWMAAALIGVLAATSNAFADPPGRVGRVSFTQGEVSVQPPDRDDWLPVGRNFPVTQDEAFWTEPGALAELQIGPIQLLMDSRTELDVDYLDYGIVQLGLPEGVVHVDVLRLPEGGVRIETPQGEVRLVEAGAYRIDAGAPDGNDRDTVLVTTLRGRAEIVGPGVRVPVEAYEAAEIDNGYRVEIFAGGPVEIDEFARRRLAEQRYDKAPRYVSDEYTGYGDLVAYGDWQQNSEYGPVWYPRGVAADWAPYRDGRWEYVAPWGWTWIDEAPWGFTPFHYGRWAQIRGRWCWSPGEFSRRPVYAPALVSFIGADANVGWVPLAPREIYQPYYPVSTTYVRNINITNVERTVVDRITIENIRSVTVNNYYNDQARTFVRQEDFRRAAPVRSVALKGASAGERRGGPVAIDRIRPLGRSAGPNGQGDSAKRHGPREDHRRVVMKPPSPGVVPGMPTAPSERSSRPGGRRDNREALSANRQGGDRRQPAVADDTRRPRVSTEQAAGIDDRRNRDGDRRGVSAGNPLARSETGRPDATADNRPRSDSAPPGAGRGERPDRDARLGRNAGTAPAPSVIVPPQQPAASVRNDRDDRRRGRVAGAADSRPPQVSDVVPRDRQGSNVRNGRDDWRRGVTGTPTQPAVTTSPVDRAPTRERERPGDRQGRSGDRPAQVDGQPDRRAESRQAASAVTQAPKPSRDFNRRDRDDRPNQTVVQPDNQPRGRRDEARQPVAAVPAPSPQPDQREERGRGRDRQRQGDASPASGAVAPPDTPPSDQDQGRRGRNGRQEGRGRP